MWVPHLYGDLNEDTITDRGYELVDSDTELWEAEEGGKQGRRGSDEDDLAELRESWEVCLFVHLWLWVKIYCHVYFVYLQYSFYNYRGTNRHTRGKLKI